MGARGLLRRPWPEAQHPYCRRAVRRQSAGPNGTRHRGAPTDETKGATA